MELAERAVDEEDDDELEPLLSRTERTTLPLELDEREELELPLRLTLEPLPELPVEELRLTLELLVDLELLPLLLTWELLEDELLVLRFTVEELLLLLLLRFT